MVSGTFLYNHIEELISNRKETRITSQTGFNSRQPVEPTKPPRNWGGFVVK